MKQLNIYKKYKNTKYHTNCESILFPAVSLPFLFSPFFQNVQMILHLHLRVQLGLGLGFECTEYHQNLGKYILRQDEAVQKMDPNRAHQSRSPHPTIGCKDRDIMVVHFSTFLHTCSSVCKITINNIKLLNRKKNIFFKVYLRIRFPFFFGHIKSIC